MFCKKGVLRKFAKFTEKHLCQSIFFNKVAGHRQNTSDGCFCSEIDLNYIIVSREYENIRGKDKTSHANIGASETTGNDIIRLKSMRQ